MLATALSTATANDYLSERFRTAYDFLANTDLLALPLGRNEIDGDDVYANVLEYDTVPASDKELEAHRDYYDVQFVARGEELLQYAPADGLETVQEYDEADDYCLLKTPVPVTSVALHAGELAVFAPEDAHKPGCTLSEPVHVRKIVVKVRA
ncbi:MAG: YhcH/YjgK/YiaL family protein [Coriobacteriaceae bacterium]|nr:YhcH/YjgK/YiaL family protein [Coriobacteriaceae bacterium]